MCHHESAKLSECLRKSGSDSSAVPKGDHTIYARGLEEEVIDGSPNHEVPKHRWEMLRKKYGLKG